MLMANPSYFSFCPRGAFDADLCNSIQFEKGLSQINFSDINCKTHHSFYLSQFLHSLALQLSVPTKPLIFRLSSFQNLNHRQANSNIKFNSTTLLKRKE